MRRAKRAASGVSTAATAKATSAARTAFVTMIAGQGSQGRPTRRRQEPLTSRETGLSSGAEWGRYAATPTAPPTPDVMPPLAHAFLALADDDALPRSAHAAARGRRRASPPSLLAVGAPLGVPRREPSDQPIAAAELQVALASDDRSSSDSDGRRTRRRGSAQPRPRPTWGLAEGDELAPGPHRAAPDRRRAPLRGDARLGRAPARRARGEGPAARSRDRPARAARPRAARPSCWRALAHPVVVRGFGAVARRARSRTWCSSTSRARRSTSCCDGHGTLALEQLLPLGLHVASALHYLAARGRRAPRRQAEQHRDGRAAAADRPQRRAHARRGRRAALADRHRRLHGARAVRPGRPARAARRRLRPRRDAARVAPPPRPARARPTSLRRRASTRARHIAPPPPSSPAGSSRSSPRCRRG